MKYLYPKNAPIPSNPNPHQVLYQDEDATELKMFPVAVGVVVTTCWPGVDPDVVAV